MAGKKAVCRVYFVDESFKAFPIEHTTTAEQLYQTVVSRIGLKEDGCFALFEKRDEMERCLEPDERPWEISKNWDQPGPGKEKGPTDPCFVFKKKIFLKDDDREMQDEVAKNLVYIQAVSNVIESVYITNLESAQRLAGLQVQVVYGDHNPANHTVGFLSQNLKNFVPKHLYSSKKPTEWETLILREHAKHKGLKSEDAKTEYLKVVKAWAEYGTTFFPACKTTNRSLPSKVIVGVNYEGIRLFKPKNKEVISEHPFTEICSWASSSGTFAFEFGNQNEATKYTFETKHGAIIAATIQTYIDILVQMLKTGDEDDDAPTTLTEKSSEGD